MLFITARFAGLPAWPVVTAVFIGLGVAAGGCAPERPRPDVLGLASAASGVGGAIVFETSEGPLDVSDAVEDPLTLPRALRLALGADPDVQAALARVRSAEAEADQSRLLPNPILSVAFRVPTGGGKSIIEAGLTEDFVALLTRPGRSEAADHRLRAAAADAVTAVLDATAEVRERYAAVQSLDALTPVLDERRSLIARLIELARDRLNAGEGTRLDLTTLESQRLELEVEIAERQLELRQERLTLARLLGRPSAPPRWKLTAWEGFPPTAAGEDAWVSAALARRPEVESGRWELAALGVEQRLARYAPFDGAGAGMDAERDPDGSVGPAVTAPLPVFDWGQARRAKAEASRVEARHRLTKVRRRIVEEVRRSYAEFEATRSTLDLVRAQLLPAQQRRRAETEAAYQAGQTDVTTLILADQDLQATRAKLIELQRKTSSALIRLERAVGGPVAAAEAEKRSSATRPATTRPQD